MAAWQLEAHRSAAALRIKPESVNEAVGVLISAFGEEWLAKACVRDLGPALPFRVHPIGNLLVPPGEDQIVSLLELVEYLKAASSGLCSTSCSQSRDNTKPTTTIRWCSWGNRASEPDFRHVQDVLCLGKRVTKRATSPENSPRETLPLRLPDAPDRT